jgi:hypothetical protein
MKWDELQPRAKLCAVLLKRSRNLHSSEFC